MRARSAILAACALVIVRALVYVAFEHAFFDSDQAIVGLMAKHLSEGRAFPLFFYGQPYMLAVESWLAVPVFWLAGPTVNALHASLLLTNLAVVVLIVAGLQRWAGLRPVHALLASLFFAFAPPYTAARLIEAQGGNIEPLLYVLVLWITRRRPLVFGAVLGVAFLNREFSVYAVPVLMVGQLLERRLFRIVTIKAWLLTAVAFLAVWDGLQALKPYADLMGPGTRGELLGGFAGSQIENLTRRVSEGGAELPGRVLVLLRDRLPELLGGRPMLDNIASQGHAWIGWLLAGLGLAAIARLAVLARHSDARRATRFAWYFAGVGAVALVAHAMSRPAADASFRYLLLALLLPIGLVAAWLRLEPVRHIRWAVTAAMLTWAAASAVDHARLMTRYFGGHEPNQLRLLADTLVARGIPIAEAPYWRAYKLAFLAREQTKFASTDFARISEYQRLAAEAGHVPRISESACAGGEEIAGFFLCPK